MASTLGALNPFRYRGYVYDTETGLYYLQSRYYDPEVGRFLNADIYMSTGQGILGNNAYAYCANNPISRVDDEGEFFNTICGAIAGGVIAVVTREKDEEWHEAALRGVVSGAIGGLALDFSIATAGTAAIAVAVGGGVIASLVDTGISDIQSGSRSSWADYTVGALVGGAMNLLFMGAGKEATTVVGKTVKEVANAVWQNAKKSTLSRAGNFMWKKLGQETGKNLLAGAGQSFFGNMFKKIGVNILTAF